MGMYAFKENKEHINYNMQVIEAIRNLVHESYQAVDDFNKLLSNKKQERTIISFAIQEIGTNVYLINKLLA